MEWKKLLDEVLSRNWSSEKIAPLNESFRKCTARNGGFNFSTSIRDVRKLVKFLELYAGSKQSLPSQMASVIKKVETEGIPPLPDLEFSGKPEYLGFMFGGFAGGTFYFKTHVVKVFPLGFHLDGNGNRVRDVQKKRGYSFFQVYLNGHHSVPFPSFPTEERLNENWEQMKRDNRIYEGSVKSIPKAD